MMRAALTASLPSLSILRRVLEKPITRDGNATKRNEQGAACQGRAALIDRRAKRRGPPSWNGPKTTTQVDHCQTHGWQSFRRDPDVIERVDPIFFADPMKALGMT